MENAKGFLLMWINDPYDRNLSISGETRLCTYPSKDYGYDARLRLAPYH